MAIKSSQILVQEALKEINPATNVLLTILIISPMLNLKQKS